MEPWPGEDFNLLNDFWSPLDQLGNFASVFDNSRVHEFEATNLSMANDSATNPITPSSDTLSQQTVSSDPPYETSKTPNYSFSFTDTHFRYSQVQTPTETKWDKSVPSLDITLPPTANSYRGKAKTQHPRKTGKRQGPLKPENAKRAAQIRRQRACWLCWLSKVPVSHTPLTFNVTP